jgi:hypothetical protein
MANKDDDFSKAGAITGGVLGGTAGLIAAATLTAASGGILAPLAGPLVAGGALAGASKGGDDPTNNVLPALGIIAKIFGGGS